MQYNHVGYRVKGFYRLGNYALKWGMTNNKNTATAEKRKKILSFWLAHGLEAT